jgi:hypothetical protein
LTTVIIASAFSGTQDIRSRALYTYPSSTPSRAPSTTPSRAPTITPTPTGLCLVPGIRKLRMSNPCAISYPDKFCFAKFYFEACSPSNNVIFESVFWNKGSANALSHGIAAKPGPYLIQGNFTVELGNTGRTPDTSYNNVRVYINSYLNSKTVKVSCPVNTAGTITPAYCN